MPRYLRAGSDGRPSVWILDLMTSRGYLSSPIRSQSGFCFYDQERSLTHAESHMTVPAAAPWNSKKLVGSAYAYRSALFKSLPRKLDALQSVRSCDSCRPVAPGTRSTRSRFRTHEVP
jgi:hypothetical protein